MTCRSVHSLKIQLLIPSFNVLLPSISRLSDLLLMLSLVCWRWSWSECPRPSSWSMLYILLSRLVWTSRDMSCSGGDSSTTDLCDHISTSPLMSAGGCRPMGDKRCPSPGQQAGDGEGILSCFTSF